MLNEIESLSKSKLIVKEIHDFTKSLEDSFLFEGIITSSNQRENRKSCWAIFIADSFSEYYFKEQ